eukprot:CAMPEP_0203947832 /NCGR_PEP_ID=MMETSP0359-20131031/82672_1 /ASSEMBLY_ACC=CAM_ASM_000338 /TAXON_ID=268821 /ORGANISM="Scrippsiella Hangoei, Strain SHTV-5" /LENGTH=143 /DNA_ID=CAMNT_0050879291 /DNA_START=29 /DNA_END=460 /DNA_ORIENTATION=+
MILHRMLLERCCGLIPLMREPQHEGAKRGQRRQSIVEAPALAWRTGAENTMHMHMVSAVTVTGVSATTPYSFMAAEPGFRLPAWQKPQTAWRRRSDVMEFKNCQYLRVRPEIANTIEMGGGAMKQYDSAGDVKALGLEARREA